MKGYRGLNTVKRSHTTSRCDAGIRARLIVTVHAMEREADQCGVIWSHGWGTRRVLE